MSIVARSIYWLLLLFLYILLALTTLMQINSTGMYSLSNNFRGKIWWIYKEVLKQKKNLKQELHMPTDIWSPASTCESMPGSNLNGT